jgi:putative ABC transport system substrate-binding protein
MFDMRRRDFITLLGGAAATFLDSRLPLEAQQANKIYRLGVLSPSSASVDSIRAVTVPELAKAGFIEGQNLVIDARAGVGSQIPELARALVASNLDAIIAVSDISIEAAKAASGTIPVMSFSTGDPVAAGLVDSLARPGGNATGFMIFEYSLSGKWLELLKQIAPGVTRAAVFRDLTQGGGTSQFAAIQAVAPSLRTRSSNEHPPRVHHAARRRGSCVAPRAARAICGTASELVAARHSMRVGFSRALPCGGHQKSRSPDRPRARRPRLLRVDCCE